MMDYHVNYSKKAQLKIQQMAFVLVAMMIFFSMVTLVYISFRIKSLETTALSSKEDIAKEIVKKIVSGAEFAFTAEDCASCLDLDKALIVSERKSYKEFWNLDYLMIEKVYPAEKGMCSKVNYPDCGSLMLINSTRYGRTTSAFVSLCRWEDGGEYYKCELGRIIASGEGIYDE